MFLELIILCCVGETVEVIHIVRGVDSNGVLLADIVVTGNVPYLPPGSIITLLPYNGEYRKFFFLVCNEHSTVYHSYAFYSMITFVAPSYSFVSLTFI